MKRNVAKNSLGRRVELKSLKFDELPFRKLKNLEIEFSPRITLIGGHNGVGKSTILGLIANSSGLTRGGSAPKSYFDKLFEANLSEIIFIDYENEFIAAQEAGAIPRPLVEYFVNGKEIIKKRCALTDRSAESKARIVPRNFGPSTKFTSRDGSVVVGPASKVPLPTLYLGMTRVLPLGEVEEDNVSNEKMDGMHEDDRRLIAEFINSVIVGAGASKDSVSSNKIKGTSKFSSHPSYEYDAKCVSLGQDSLGSIAAAIASFQMLKREWSEYPGGLLIIDELDAGFHPRAILNLVGQLERFADELELQVVATTHSPKLIEAVHPKNGTKASKNSVVYLMDTRSPYVMHGGDLQEILDDMDLVPPSVSAKNQKPVLRVYLEDEEAAEIFNDLIPASIKRALGRVYGVAIKVYALGVGCNSLANLSSIDSHFKLSLFALDADSVISKSSMRHGNLVKLPGIDEKSPERTVFSFIQDLIDNPSAHPAAWAKLKKMRITTDQVQAHLLNWDGDLSDRKHAKKWWRDRIKYIRDWGIFKIWMDENPGMVTDFRSSFDQAVKVVAKRLRTQARVGKV